MNNEFNRIRVWTEQGNVTVPQLFFQFYKRLDVSDVEAMLILHLLAFHEEGKDFPTPVELEARANLQQNEIASMLQRLMQKGLIELKQDVDAAGKYCEQFSLYPLWSRILDQLESSQIQIVEEKEELDERALFKLFEQELGRLLSPMEIETLGMWLDIDGHSPAIIKSALKEAVLAEKISLRYIDRILFEWKKKNITSVEQVEKHAEQYRQNTMGASQNRKLLDSVQQESKPRVTFYNWLEERE